jgi:hypothetical protein
MKNKNKKIIALFILSNIAFLYITPIMYSFNTNLYPRFYYLLRGFLIILSLILFLKIISKSIKKITSKNKQGVLSVITIFILFFYIAELFFTFFAQTNGLNDTYCSITWKYKYWKQNEQGFRDIDFRNLELENKPKIFFIGDSYTEGHGIKNVEDRTSNIIRKKYPNYTIYNLGKCGWNIHDEIQLLQHVPIKPNYIFLQICSNDWDYLQQQLSLHKKSKNYNVYYAGVEFSLAKYSVFINYLKSNFNNLINFFVVEKVGENEILKAFEKLKIDKKLLSKAPKNGTKFLKFCVKNSKLPKSELDQYFIDILKTFQPNIRILTSNIFKDYLNQLKTLNEFCKSNQIRLVLIPYPSFSENSIQVFENVTHPILLKKLVQNNLEVINILPDLQKVNLKTYEVNRYDAHANAESNKIIANTISQYINLNFKP